MGNHRAVLPVLAGNSISYIDLQRRNLFNCSKYIVVGSLSENRELEKNIGAFKTNHAENLQKRPEGINVADKNGKISVIVPVYNSEKYLEEAVNSIQIQEYTNWELFLIVSDSEDKSQKICEAYAEKYENVYVLYNESRGIGSARNQGMKAAEGEYILFIDADDYLPDSGVLGRYVNIARQINSDIVVSNYVRLWNQRILPAIQHDSFSGYDRGTEEFRFCGFFSVGTLSYVWGKLYRRSFLEKNKLHFTDFPYAEDKLFNMQCYCCGAKYAFLENVGYVYRRNQMSVSYKYDPDAGRCWLGIAESLRSWISAEFENPEMYEDLIQYTIFFASFFDAKTEYQKGRKSIWSIRKMLKIYGKNGLARECFCKLSTDKRIREMDQKLWIILIRGFSWGMKRRCYFLLSLGIKELINKRVDERMSDTGLRE